jgi:aromatic ring-opening dioxygenase catalytic subunit (LigB family)
MYPNADVPVVEMSLVDSLDPLLHIQIGQALAPLRQQGVHIIGSGMSFHNFDYFFTRSPQTKAAGVRHAKVFDKMLVDTFTGVPALSQQEQVDKLVQWSQSPSGTEAHKLGQEEHLIPLHVAFGAGVGEDAAGDNHDEVVKCRHFGFEIMDGLVYSSLEFYS